MGQCRTINERVIHNPYKLIGECYREQTGTAAKCIISYDNNAVRKHDAGQLGATVERIRN